MSTAAGAVLAAILGSVAGAYLNVVAERLPRGESLRPPLRRLVPFARPRRRREPLVELATAALCAGVVLRYGTIGGVALPLLLVLLLVPVTLIDLDHRIIPNALMAVGALGALILLLALHSSALTQHLIALAAAGGFFLIAALVYPAGMGMGDVKLAGVLGLALGRAVAPAIFVALLAGTIVGAWIVARVGAARGRKVTIPFGPWLALGGVVGVFAGDAIVDWWTGA